MVKSINTASARFPWTMIVVWVVKPKPTTTIFDVPCYDLLSSLSSQDERESKESSCTHTAVSSFLHWRRWCPRHQRHRQTTDLSLSTSFPPPCWSLTRRMLIGCVDWRPHWSLKMINANWSASWAPDLTLTPNDDDHASPYNDDDTLGESVQSITGLV